MTELALKHRPLASEITASIEAAMRERYCAPEWALLFGVGNSTGSRCAGWADAIAMSLYPSRGLAVHGFEFKASRGDWKKELDNPAKAENVARFCDYWWLVAEAGIVRDDELPMAWGMYEHRDGKLKLTKGASQLKPDALDRGFVAAVLRRAQQADQSVIDALVRKQVEEDRKGHERSRAEALEHSRGKAGKLAEKARKLKELTGIDLLNWMPEESIAAAIKLVLDSGVVNSYNGLAEIVRNAEHFAQTARAAAEKAGIDIEKGRLL